MRIHNICGAEIEFISTVIYWCYLMKEVYGSDRWVASWFLLAICNLHEIINGVYFFLVLCASASPDAGCVSTQRGDKEHPVSLLEAACTAVRN